MRRRLSEADYALRVFTGQAAQAEHDHPGDPVNMLCSSCRTVVLPVWLGCRSCLCRFGGAYVYHWQTEHRRELRQIIRQMGKMPGL